MEFRLKEGFIELDNMLKVLGLVASGAEAKQGIRSGEVKVNGRPETRVRRKLRSGDAVDFKDRQISVL
ncbi:MAG: RNA-binding S4 domain-containing protein [Candidatus Omnitrophica bacterium]|nr:RNA-binding S4 domain-containing protein [Candidatus Omnitrophota bacterium]